METVVLQRCCFDLEARDEAGRGFAKKPTKVWSSLPSIASVIDRSCDGGCWRAHFLSGRAKAAAEHTRECCSAIVCGIEVYNRHLGQALSGNRFLVEEGPLSSCAPDMCDPNGGLLPMDLVRQVWRSELQGFAQRRVYESRPRWECEQEGGGYWECARLMSRKREESGAGLCVSISIGTDSAMMRCSRPLLLYSHPSGWFPPWLGKEPTGQERSG